MNDQFALQQYWNQERLWRAVELLATGDGTLAERLQVAIRDGLSRVTAEDFEGDEECTIRLSAIRDRVSQHGTSLKHALEAMSVDQQRALAREILALDLAYRPMWPEATHEPPPTGPETWFDVTITTDRQGDPVAAQRVEASLSTDPGPFRLPIGWASTVRNWHGMLEISGGVAADSVEQASQAAVAHARRALSHARVSAEIVHVTTTARAMRRRSRA